MKLIVEEIALTRLQIEPDPELLTHDDVIAGPVFAEKVTFSGPDRATLCFLVTDPAFLGKFRPGQVYTLSLEGPE